MSDQARAGSTAFVKISTRPIYECGAELMAFLAFPEPGGDELRADAHSALCYVALRAMAQDDPAWAWSDQLIKPAYLAQESTAVQAALKTFDRRLRDRLAAARMAIAFLQEAESGLRPKLPRGVKRPSIKEMAALVLSDVGASDPENVETRVWKQSLPVIHLAAAFAVVIDIAEKGGVPRLRPDHLMRSPELIEAVLVKAEYFETLLPKARKLKSAASNIWRFRRA